MYHRRQNTCKKSGNTWFRISWHISPTQDIRPDYRFVKDNKPFIGLANIIHENKGVSEELKDLVNQNIMECDYYGDLREQIEENILKKFNNISTEPIYADEITEESLESANAIILGMFFCLPKDIEEFSKIIIENHPLETLLKVLARMLSVPNEKKLTRYYSIAKNLFDKTSSLMNLSNKHIAVLTTAASDLARYPDLTNHQVSQEISRSKFLFPFCHIK